MYCSTMLGVLILSAPDRSMSPASEGRCNQEHSVQDSSSSVGGRKEEGRKGSTLFAQLQSVASCQIRVSS